jgi:DNA-directed RNA polymerase subunit RPC12/RpoP
MIYFACPKCGKKFRTRDHHAGRRFDCHQCGQRLAIPSLPAPTKDAIRSHPLRLTALLIVVVCIILGLAVGAMLIWLATRPARQRVAAGIVRAAAITLFDSDRQPGKVTSPGSS